MSSSAPVAATACSPCARAAAWPTPPSSSAWADPPRRAGRSASADGRSRLTVRRSLLAGSRWRPSSDEEPALGGRFFAFGVNARRGTAWGGARVWRFLLVVPIFAFVLFVWPSKPDETYQWYESKRETRPRSAVGSIVSGSGWPGSGPRR